MPIAVRVRSDPKQFCETRWSSILFECDGTSREVTSGYPTGLLQPSSKEGLAAAALRLCLEWILLFTLATLSAIAQTESSNIHISVQRYLGGEASARLAPIRGNGLTNMDPQPTASIRFPILDVYSARGDLIGRALTL